MAAGGASGAQSRPSRGLTRCATHAALLITRRRIHKRLIDLHSPADVVKQITSILIEPGVEVRERRRQLAATPAPVGGRAACALTRWAAAWPRRYRAAGGGDHQRRVSRRPVRGADGMRGASGGVHSQPVRATGSPDAPRRYRGMMMAARVPAGLAECVCATCLPPHTVGARTQLPVHAHRGTQRVRTHNPSRGQGTAVQLLPRVCAFVGMRRVRCGR